MSPNAGALLFRQPDVEKLFRFNEIDLLVQSRAIHRHQGIVSLVGRTAESIFNDDGTKAEIYCTQCGSKHAHVGLAAGNHNRLDMLADQEIVKT